MTQGRLTACLAELEARVRHRVALASASRAATVAILLSVVTILLGLSMPLPGLAVLVAVPLVVYAISWSLALGGTDSDAARIALAKAIDSELAAEDRIPSSLDPGLYEREDAPSALLAADVAALEERAIDVATRLAPMPWRQLFGVPAAALLLPLACWLAPVPAPVVPDEMPPELATLDETARQDIADLLADVERDAAVIGDERDPLADLARKISEPAATPSEALAAASETMAALERERAEVEREGERLDSLAQALEKYEEMRALAKMLLDRRLSEARARLREMREEIERERKMLMSGKDARTPEERQRRLEELSESERRLDELDKEMDRYADRLRKLNRRVDATRRVTDRVRYAQRQRERQRYLDWLEEEREGEGGRGGPRRLGGDRRGSGQDGGGDDWGEGTASHDGAPQRTSVAKVMERVAAAEGEGGVTRFFVSSDNDGSKSRIDVRDVVAELERRALDTIYQEEVPLSFRRYVASYFDRVKPPPASGD